MKTNYQERILNSIRSNTGLGMQYSNYEILSALEDCFAITRLQNEIAMLSKPAAFNNFTNADLQKKREKYEELSEILSKYPNVFDKLEIHFYK